MDLLLSMENRSQYEYCNIAVTPDMAAFIREVTKTCTVPDHLLCHFNHENRDLSDSVVPFRHFRALYQLASKTGDFPCLHRLLAGTQVVLPKPIPQERSPELEARLERLRADQANREYDLMTCNIGGAISKRTPADEKLSTQVKSMNRQLTFVVNFVITVGCAFAFGYKAAEMGLASPNVALQLICGMVLALGVFVADLYFMLKSDLNF